MNLTHACIFTDDVDTLRSFYQQVLQLEPSMGEGTYEEFETPGCVLALFGMEGMEKLAPGAAASGANRSIILEFRVDDVDAEYARLQELGVDWVKPPTTQPWGNRSIYFRDPDGNLVNFYSRVENG